ncbi:MAG: hypothetical protein ABI779_02855 [Acidobacteriota bacterium]
MRLRIAIATLLLVSAAAHVSARPAARPAVSPRTACDLLTKSEVAAVQGEAYAKTSLTNTGAKSQCFYELPSFVNSVSLDILRDDAATYWRRNFGEEREENEEAEREGKGKEAGPKVIRGIGREAFWTGNRTGSLYVFNGRAVLRISVGGPGTEAEKIARSKKLAANALRRM